MRKYRLVVAVGFLMVLLLGAGIYLSLRRVKPPSQNKIAYPSPRTVAPTVDSPATRPKKTPDETAPKAKSCDSSQTNTIVTVTLNTDAPSPRCLKVTSTQQLRIKNNTDKQVDASIGLYQMTINAHESTLLAPISGSHLESGVHLLKVASMYDVEIWLGQ